jgi:hypothetical protein
MAADITLTTATASVQNAPTPKTKLSTVRGTPDHRVVVDTYTVADVLEAGDKIRVRIVQGGSEILPVLSDIIEATTASALILDVGIYQLAADRSIGTVVDADILADGVDFAGSGVFIARPYLVPITDNEYWIVAEVKSVTGNTVAGETIDFYSAINSAN